MYSSLIGGIEGGATQSSAVLIEESGKIVGRSKGHGTNHHLIGMNECRKRIATLVEQAKIDAGLSADTPLTALGLSLSGCEQEETNEELVQGLIEGYPNLSEKYVVGSDTEGSVAATSNKGGVTCIAGTGSNTLLINPDGTKSQCGGWGYLLGDEGSAFWISFRGIKYCFNHLDNFEDPPHSTERVWQVVKDHLKLKKPVDILDCLHKNFCKAHIASICKKFSDLAREGDELSMDIFREAGRDLARSISAVIQKAAKELTDREGGIHVLCVGSVWLSWDLLQLGFIEWLEKNTNITKLSLMKLNTEMGVGAAYLASDKLNLPLERDYSNNYTVFFRYAKD